MLAELDQEVIGYAPATATIEAAVSVQNFGLKWQIFGNCSSTAESQRAPSVTKLTSNC